jgi:hypothetical protein
MDNVLPEFFYWEGRQLLSDVRAHLGRVPITNSTTEIIVSTHLNNAYLAFTELINATHNTDWTFDPEWVTETPTFHPQVVQLKVPYKRLQHKAHVPNASSLPVVIREKDGVFNYQHISAVNPSISPEEARWLQTQNQPPAPQPPAPVPPPPPKEEPIRDIEVENDTPEEHICTICHDYLRRVAMQPCGHARTCYSCAKTLLDASKPCPYCRTPIKSLALAIM